MRRSIAALAAALLFCLMPALPAGAQAPAPPDLDDYRQVLEGVLEMVNQDEAGQAADVLAGITEVTLPSGEAVPVDHAVLLRALRANPPDLALAEEQLSALRFELANWPRGPVAPDAFDKLAGILARPEFAPPAPLPELTLPEWLDDLFEVLGWLGRPLLILTVVLLGGIAAYFAFSMWGSFASRAEAKEDRADGEQLTAAQALTRSRELAQAGDYRTAIRLLYLSTLLLLEERGVLRYDRTLTNREYLWQAQQADREPLVRAMRPVVDTFDEVWYGQAEPNAERYDAYVQQVDELREVGE